MQTFSVNQIIQHCNQYYQVVSLQCRYQLKDESHQKIIERFKNMEFEEILSEEEKNKFLKKINKTPLGHLFDTYEDAQKHIFQKDYLKNLAKISKKSTFSFNSFNKNVDSFNKPHIQDYFKKDMPSISKKYGLTIEDYEIIEEDSNYAYIKPIYNLSFQKLSNKNNFSQYPIGLYSGVYFVNVENFWKCVDFIKNNPI